MAEKKKIGRAKILAGSLVLVVVLCGVWSVYLKKNTFDYYRLKPLDINQTVLASGRVSFPQPYEITAASSGKISTVNCCEGELVQEGQLLLQMDDYQDRQSVQLALSDLNLMRSKQRNIAEEVLPRQEEQMRQDRVKLEEAEKELDRMKTLFEQGAVPAVDLKKPPIIINCFFLSITRPSLPGTPWRGEAAWLK